MTKHEKTAGIFFHLRGGIWLSIVTCFMLFIYAPLELLFTNQDEFWFDIYILVPIMSAVFGIVCVISILAFVLLRKWNENIYRIGLVIYLIAFISLYIQGNWLTGNLPLLDGEPIDWSLYKTEYMQSYILWIVVAAIVVIIYRKADHKLFENMIKVVSICMILMFCVTLCTLALSNNGFDKKPGLVVTTKNMFRMSEDSNLIILLLDAVDARNMNEIMEENPDYRDIFTDFTYFPNMLGTYPATKYSIPYILSGQWYENETTFREYEAEAYTVSPLFMALEETGYHIGLYEAELLSNDEGKARYENVLPSQRGLRNKLMFIKWEIQMTGFKYAPYCLKPHTFVNLKDFNTTKIPPEGETVFTISNSDFYNRVLNEDITYLDDKCFKFIHINGGHAPFIYNEKVEEIAPEDGSYNDNIKASLTITRDYINKLKAAGVYDNSAIIIMADHGYGPENYYGRQNPVFFVKGINEKHDFNVSEAPVSYVDLQEAYVRLMNGADSEQIFDWKSGDQRERRYLFYEYSEDDYMIEYMQPGRADDVEAMYETGNVYSR
ncbi:MAG: LTA synthase family protein [Lachnospiraceae bacterium]|nr:LTA synthase family protein [Lachnospiraceae bacterium]